MTHTAPIFTTQQCADAIDQAELTPCQLELVKALLEMRQGTAEQFTEAVGGVSYKSTFNSQLGVACRKLAEVLGWQRADGRHWLDLILCFENAAYRDDLKHSIWSVRGNWIGAL